MLARSFRTASDIKLRPRSGFRQSQRSGSEWPAVVDLRRLGGTKNAARTLLCELNFTDSVWNSLYDVEFHAALIANRNGCRMLCSTDIS
jgi:hypothetical protein